MYKEKKRPPELYLFTELTQGVGTLSICQSCDTNLKIILIVVYKHNNWVFTLLGEMCFPQICYEVSTWPISCEKKKISLKTEKSIKEKIVICKPFHLWWAVWFIVWFICLWCVSSICFSHSWESGTYSFVFLLPYA